MPPSLHDRVAAALADQYDVTGEIGRGGMSVVYQARDRRLGRTVAVKVLPPELAYEPAIRTRFTREAQTSAQLAHAHIVPIFDVGERDGIAWFAMGLVTGGTLGTLLAHEPRQPIAEVRRIAREVADALAFAHARGVIHRDVKPDNVLLDRDTGRAMVTDFGIAQAIEAGARLTLTGIAVGTPAYMSPEQATGEREVDGRSDVYALGVVAYQMLTGRTPFSAGNSMALLVKHCTERVTPIADLRPDAPAALCAAIERALAKAPEDRWPTAAAFRDALGEDAGSPAPWRADGRRESVRYASPVPAAARRRGASGERVRAEPRPEASAPGAHDALGRDGRVRDGLVLEPPHLAALTVEQRAELRLWRGRLHLLDRVKLMRRYTAATAVVTAAATIGIFAIPDAPPLVVGPFVSAVLIREVRQRARSLRASGLRLRDALFAWTARRALRAPAPPATPAPDATPAPTRRQLARLAKLAPPAVLETPHGAAVRRAVADRQAIVAMVGALSRADRKRIPDVLPTATALVERVGTLAQALQRLDESVDPRRFEELDARIARLEEHGAPAGSGRRLALVRRQRESLEELARDRDALAGQLESACLALGTLRLDLVKYRASGGQAALAGVTSATQEARALSRDIGALLEAQAELREL